MYVINALFRDIHEVTLGSALSEIGVYVLWSSAAEAAPSYIGEGRIVSRIGSHLEDEAKPFVRSSEIEGCIAILSPGKPWQQRKTDAEILEHTLLIAAERVGRFPRHNRAPGKESAVFRRGARHETIRVSISGQHPLRFRSRIAGTDRLVWRWDDYEGWMLSEFPWRTTARLAPVG